MRAKSSEEVRSVIRNAARKMSGAKRRECLAAVTVGFFSGNARKAEREFGWGGGTINKGLRELATGIIFFYTFYIKIYKYI